MVSQDQKNDITEYDLDHLVQSSFNYGDDYLLEKMQKAEQTISDDQIPPEPEDGFERLMAKIKEGSISAYSASDEDLESRRSAPAEEPEKRRKKRRLHTIIRIAIAAAIVGSVFTMTSVSVGAKKSYEFEMRSQGKKNNQVVINNNINKENLGSLEEAYEEIQNKLGIRVLTMKTRPETVKYSSVTISNGLATISFDIEGQMLIFLQQIKTTENSSNISSDRLEEVKVFNEWLQKDIIIKKCTLDNGKVELSTTIIDGNGCYYLAGIANETIFIDIVQNLAYVE